MHSTAHLYDEIKYLSLQFIHFERLIDSSQERLFYEITVDIFSSFIQHKGF